MSRFLTGNFGLFDQARHGMVELAPEHIARAGDKVASAVDEGSEQRYPHDRKAHEFLDVIHHFFTAFRAGNGRC